MQNNTFSGLIVGQKIVVLDQVDSTNSYLKLELAKSTPVSEGTVILAEEQFAGRGQAGSKWLSQPGQNLTFSVFLHPHFIPLTEQFTLNIAISLAINDVLSVIIGDEVKIKWPNDIYWRSNKIGGILIENSVQGANWKSAIVGIGLNVNQIAFDPALSHVSSLKAITGAEHNKGDVLRAICEAMNKRYFEIPGKKDEQKSEYLNCLLGYGEERAFVLAKSGEKISGIIKDVDSFGRILIQIDGDMAILSFKELVFVNESHADY